MRVWATARAAFRPPFLPAAMAVAAFGLLPPAFGALLQEGIDVAVILNALWALGGGEPVDGIISRWTAAFRRVCVDGSSGSPAD